MSGNNLNPDDFNPVATRKQKAADAKAKLQAALQARSTHEYPDLGGKLVDIQPVLHPRTSTDYFVLAQPGIPGAALRECGLDPDRFLRINKGSGRNEPNAYYIAEATLESILRDGKPLEKGIG
jgi:hypothetical protein